MIVLLFLHLILSLDSFCCDLNEQASFFLLGGIETKGFVKNEVLWFIKLNNPKQLCSYASPIYLYATNILVRVTANTTN